jgi:hypothetical protein
MTPWDQAKGGKPRPNHQRYLGVLRQMTPEQRLTKAFELTELARATFRAGLRIRFPDISEPDLQDFYLKRLAQCHNTNY